MNTAKLIITLAMVYGIGSGAFEVLTLIDRVGV